MSQGIRPFSARTTGALLGAAFAISALQPSSVWACAACYGQDSGPLASGMNWGIASLLGMIVVVLGGVAGFFIYLARRSAALGAAQNPGLQPAPAAAKSGPGWSSALRAGQPSRAEAH